MKGFHNIHLAWLKPDQCTQHFISLFFCPTRSIERTDSAARLGAGLNQANIHYDEAGLRAGLHLVQS